MKTSRYLVAAALVAFGALLILAVCNRAHAADLRGSVKDTFQAPTTFSVSPRASWTGIWFAALVGYDMSNTNLTLDAFNNHEENENFGDRVGGAHLDGLGGEGFTATVQLGGDYQIGERIVAGGWAEYTFGGVESSAGVDYYGYGTRLDVEQNDSYGFFGRAGVLVGAERDTLLYGAAGWVFTEADAKLSGDGFGTIRKTFEFDGPAAEVGVEHRFAPGIRGKVSARYTWLDEQLLSHWGDDDCERYELNGEPGVWGVKVGVVISTEAMFGSR